MDLAIRYRICKIESVNYHWGNSVVASQSRVILFSSGDEQDMYIGIILLLYVCSYGIFSKLKQILRLMLDKNWKKRSVAISTDSSILYFLQSYAKSTRTRSQPNQFQKPHSYHKTYKVSFLPQSVLQPRNYVTFKKSRFYQKTYGKSYVRPIQSHFYTNQV
jgi:hypothetical protein